MRRLIILVLSLTMLSGCLPVVIAAGGAVLAGLDGYQRACEGRALRGRPGR